MPLAARSLRAEAAEETARTAMLSTNQTKRVKKNLRSRHIIKYVCVKDKRTVSEILSVFFEIFEVFKNAGSLFLPHSSSFLCVRECVSVSV